MLDSSDTASWEKTITEPIADTRFRLLYELGCAFASRLEIDELIPLVVAKCRETFAAESVAVLLLDTERNELYFPYVAGESPEFAERLARARFPADQGIAGAVVANGRPLRIDDAQADSRFYPGIDRTSGLTTRSLLSAPLRSRHETMGVIQIVNRRGGGTFSDEDLALLDALAGSVAVAIENARLYSRVKASEERLRAQVGVLRRDIARRDRFGEIIGTSAAMAPVLHLMESAATSPIAVIIQGETGTGKELVARGIHRASSRGEGPFIAVNCAALPESLLESELFGHRRGAFTGAIQDKRGLFEAADGSTIFLDEVGEMPLGMQAKLLRVLQEGEVVPVGDTRPRKIDVRVISATNRDLEAAVAERAFREDLYYRLAAFPIRVPPLRSRSDDIPLLVDHIVAAAAERHKKNVLGVEPEALALLTRYQWPGNVRELQNEIERAVALTCDGETISAEQLSEKLGGGDGGIGAFAAESAPDNAADTESERTPGWARSTGPGRGRTSADPTSAQGGRRPLRDARTTFEIQYIAETLRAHSGNVSRSAAALGLSRVMLQKKMKEYDLR